MDEADLLSLRVREIEEDGATAFYKMFGRELLRGEG
jgi:hypothetical protein